MISTPDSGYRPLRQAGLQGTSEEVTVPAGKFTAVKAPHRNGTVWVSDQVPAIGIVKGVYPDGQLDLVKRGTGGTQDRLAHAPAGTVHRHLDRRRRHARSRVEKELPL